jgi:hypothetical protein
MNFHAVAAPALVAATTASSTTPSDTIFFVLVIETSSGQTGIFARFGGDPTATL